MEQRHEHHAVSNYTITFVVFKDLNNAKELRQGVMNGKFEATLLKPHLICDPFQVLVAANKAVHLNKTDRMTTKNVHSEVLFCLSPTKNISDSFRKFGMGENDTSAFIVILNDSEDKTLSQLRTLVQATEVCPDEVKEMADINTIKKIYKVTDTELSCSPLTDVLVSKIASKEFVTF